MPTRTMADIAAIEDVPLADRRLPESTYAALLASATRTPALVLSHGERLRPAAHMDVQGARGGGDTCGQRLSRPRRHRRASGCIRVAELARNPFHDLGWGGGWRCSSAQSLTRAGADRQALTRRPNPCARDVGARPRCGPVEEALGRAYRSARPQIRRLGQSGVLPRGHGHPANPRPRRTPAGQRFRLRHH
jgi:hypothetical protein